MTQPKLAAQIEDDTISVDLGDRVFDLVTGFKGVVTSVTLYDSASARIYVEAVAEGGKIFGEWFDAARVKLDKLPSAGVGG